MKFEIGQKVKVTKKCNDIFNDSDYIGRVGKIIETDVRGPYNYRLDVDSSDHSTNPWFYEDQLELVTSQFHVGMRVKILSHKLGDSGANEYCCENAHKTLGKTGYISEEWGENFIVYELPNGDGDYFGHYGDDELQPLTDEEEKHEDFFSVGIAEDEMLRDMMKCSTFPCITLAPTPNYQDLLPKKKGSLMRKLTAFLKRTLDKKVQNFYKLGWVVISGDELMVTEEGVQAYVDCQMIGDGDMEKYAAKKVAELKKEEDEE